MSTVTKSDKAMAEKFKDLIGPTDPAVDREVRELLVTARICLLLTASFFGNLATRMKLINADTWCATAATDGRNFYYNTRFIKLLRPKEIEFLFGHEVLHCVYDHLKRRDERHPMLWNVSNDYCVNGDLKKHRVGEFITSVPCLYDAKYLGMSSEQIYALLYEAADKINIDDLMDQLLDEHIDGDDDDDDDEPGQGRPKKLTPEEKQQIREEIKEAVLSAAQTCGVGDLPAGVKRLIQDMTEPKMNWRELLRTNLESTIKSDFTWLRASRRGWDMDAIMPGMKKDELIDIAIFLDASGSISACMLKDFLSEVAGIMESFSCYRIHVATFDTQVYNPQQYDSENLDSITDYDIEGGGGTDFGCMFDYMKEKEIEPHRMVVFTDGLPFGTWGDENYADTLWIIHGSENIVPPFGQHEYYTADT